MCAWWCRWCVCIWVNGVCYRIEFLLYGKLRYIRTICYYYNYNFLVPMRCTENSGPGKAVSRHSMVLPSFVSPVCSVFMFPYHRLWGLLYYDKFGCMPYTWRGCQYKQVCTRVDLEGWKTVPHPGVAKCGSPVAPGDLKSRRATWNHGFTRPAGDLNFSVFLRHDLNFSETQRQETLSWQNLSKL